MYPLYFCDRTLKRDPYALKAFCIIEFFNSVIFLINIGMAIYAEWDFFDIFIFSRCRKGEDKEMNGYIRTAYPRTDDDFKTVEKNPLLTDIN